MSYKVFVEKKALKEIKKLPDKDRERIKNILRELPDFPSNFDIKKLAGLHNKFRIRSGKYRIIFEIEDGILTVISVLPRKDAYKR